AEAAEADAAHYKEQAEANEKKANFLDTHIGVIGKNDTTYYHRYGCPYLDTSSFTAHNTNYAKGNGYSACPYCW
ncbi:MAG: hypothetical protein IJP03_04935, partial [Christensenellaceae bacterium]|nr:hypothetical protein [Christensenellaceae bacterium]